MTQRKQADTGKWFCAFFLALCLLPLTARATTARRVGVKEISKLSHLVVVGTPGDRTSRWIGGRIVTETEVLVEAFWAGLVPPSHTIKVQTLGGVVGDIGQAVHGTPRLPRGERLVLFLQRAEDGAHRVVAMEQGVYTLRPGETGELIIEPPETTSHLVGPQPSIAPRSIDTFRRLVQESFRGR